jgi:putative transposon-encoded protein
MATKIKIGNGEIKFEDKFEKIIDKVVTKYGTGAKVDCPKEFLGRKVYLLIRPK